MSRASLRSVLAPLCGLLLLLACDAEPAQWRPPDPLELPKDFVECLEDSECVRVELGCCDACNGGADVAVPGEMAEQMKARYGQPCSGATVCTQRVCEPKAPVCEGGTCQLIDAKAAQAREQTRGQDG